MTAPDQLHAARSDLGVNRLAQLARRALVTTKDPSATIARAGLGGVLLPHGAQHLFGSFGGYGYIGTRDWMVATLGVPGPLAGFAIVMEAPGRSTSSSAAHAPASRPTDHGEQRAGVIARA